MAEKEFYDVEVQLVGTARIKVRAVSEKDAREVARRRLTTEGLDVAYSCNLEIDYSVLVPLHAQKAST